MAADGTLAVASLLALLIVLCFGWFAVRSYTTFEREAALHGPPLIESPHRRLEAALRDAKDGFKGCGACGFENFQRVRFCTLCGEALDDDTQDQGHDKERTQDVKRSRVSMCRRPTHHETRSVASRANPPTLATRRRFRAQRRKEWRRRVDVEGRAYWFHEARLVHAHAASTAFVVAFEPTTTELRVLCKPFAAQLQPSVCERRAHNGLPTATFDDLELPSPVASFSILEDADSPRCPSVSGPVPVQGYTMGDDTDPTITDWTNSETAFVGSMTRCMETLGRFVDEWAPVLLSVSDPRVDASKLSISVRPFPAHDTTSAVIASISDAAKDFPSKYAYFVMSASRLLVPADKEHLRLNIARISVFKDSMESLAVTPVRNLHSGIRINFRDEHGIDAGGLHREWFLMLNEALMDPDRGLFVCNNKSEQTYYLSSCSNVDILPHQLVYLLAAGRLFGRALLEGSMMCFHLAPPLLKLMLGYPLSFSDLEDVEPETYNNLCWLLDNNDVDMLGLNFSVTINDGDQYRDVELVPGGNEITVTDSNKTEYVQRRWQYSLIESVAPQLQVFLRGLYEIIPLKLLVLFDPVEFDFLLCGFEEIDVEDWERNTKYSGKLCHQRVLKWFWELVHEMPNEYRRRLLQFATGSSRVPLGGFSALTSYDGRLCPFTLKVVSPVGDGFIHSHACFNCLDLSIHTSRDKLKAMLYAILETEAYGFTTD